MDVSIVCNMLKFIYSIKDIVDDGRSIELTWDGEEENIWDIVEKFKCFLLAKTYSPSLVNRVVYLSNDQLAKLHLAGDAPDDL